MLLRFRVPARSLSASCQSVVASSYHRYASNTPPEDDSKGNEETNEAGPSPKGTIDAPIGRERNRGRNPAGGRGRSFASQNTPRDQQKTPFFPSFIQDITNNTQASRTSARDQRKPPTKKWEPAQPDQQQQQQQLQQQQQARQADQHEQANRLFAALEASDQTNQQGTSEHLEFLNTMIFNQKAENLDQKLSSDSRTIKMASSAFDTNFDEFMQGSETAEEVLDDMEKKRLELVSKQKDTDPENKDFLSIFRGTQVGIRHFLGLNPGQQSREDRIRNNPFLTRPTFQFADVLRKIPVEISEDRLQWLRQGLDNVHEREPGPDGQPRLHKYAVVSKEDGSLEFGDPELQELYDQATKSPAQADGAEAPAEPNPEEAKLIEKLDKELENIILDMGEQVNAVFSRAQPLGYVKSGGDLTEDSIWLKSMELEVVRRRARRDRLKKIHQTRRERSQPDGYRKPPKPLQTIESRILRHQETRGAYTAQDLLHDATTLNKKSPSPAGVRLAKETFSADEQKLIDDVVQRHLWGSGPILRGSPRIESAGYGQCRT